MKFFISFIALLCISTTYAKSIEVWSYNVENLFDVTKDEGKNDWTFLPNKMKGKKAECEKVKSYRRRNECLNTDWTKEKLETKFEKINEVLTKGRNGLPDILCLVEIENANVIKDLAKFLGYKNFEVSNSPDKRGIDLAVLWNESKEIKKTAMREIVLKGEYFKKRPSRNILEVEFLLGGKYPLSVFVNHWPSLGNPTKTRLTAARLLKKQVSDRLKKKNHHVLAVGDFNTIHKNHPHPFKDVLLKKSGLKDLHTSFMKNKDISRKIKGSLPPGTYFYAREMAWNNLDRIFYSQNLTKGKGLKLEVDSYRIYAPSFITKTYKYEDKRSYLHGSEVKRTPFRYNHETDSFSKAGYSDHFPLTVKLKY